MTRRRFKVLSSFPTWRRKEDMKLGEIIDVEPSPVWPEVGGGFYLPDSPKTDVPDFTGGRLNYLLKHKFLQELRLREFLVCDGTIAGYQKGDTVRLEEHGTVKAPHEVELWKDRESAYSFTDGALEYYMVHGSLREQH